MSTCTIDRAPHGQSDTKPLRGRRLQGVLWSESSRYSTLKHFENVFWSYLAEFAELRGAPPKQSCQEWYEVREITRDSAWGRLRDGNVFYGSIRTLLLHSS